MRSTGDAPDRSRIAAEEVADIIAEPPVPFFPGVADEAADLVEPGLVRRLGKLLGPGESRLRIRCPRAPAGSATDVSPTRRWREDRRQIEAGSQIDDAFPQTQ